MDHVPYWNQHNFLEISDYIIRLPLSPATSASHARSSHVVGSADLENFEASAPLGRDSWAYALSDRSGLLVSASLPFDLYFGFSPEEPLALSRTITQGLWPLLSSLFQAGSLLLFLRVGFGR